MDINNTNAAKFPKNPLPIAKLIPPRLYIEPTSDI